MTQFMTECWYNLSMKASIFNLPDVRKYTRFPVAALVAALLFSGCTGNTLPARTNTETAPVNDTIRLPEPKSKGEMSLEETLLERRSVREYSAGALKLDEISQLLWAAQGKTSESGGRTAPAAGGLYPLEIYLVSGNVENATAGIYKYSPERHELIKIKDGDFRDRLAAASLGQSWVEDGAIAIVIAAVYERTTEKYGERGTRYVQMEAGHAAQNLCLQATALGFGTVTVGAFDDNRVKEVIGMQDNESPLYVIPAGRK
jgi:SagB-type dehydrogenase family enzyme